MIAKKDAMLKTTDNSTATVVRSDDVPSLRDNTQTTTGNAIAAGTNSRFRAGINTFAQPSQW